MAKNKIILPDKSDLSSTFDKVNQKFDKLIEKATTERQKAQQKYKEGPTPENLTRLKQASAYVSMLNTLKKQYGSVAELYNSGKSGTTLISPSQSLKTVADFKAAVQSGANALQKCQISLASKSVGTGFGMPKSAEPKLNKFESRGANQLYANFYIAQVYDNVVEESTAEGYEEAANLIKMIDGLGKKINIPLNLIDANAEIGRFNPPQPHVAVPIVKETLKSTVETRLGEIFNVVQTDDSKLFKLSDYLTGKVTTFLISYKSALNTFYSLFISLQNKLKTLRLRE